MPIKDWTKDTIGNIALNPFVGYETATLPHGGSAVRIQYVSSPDQPIEKPHVLQLGMTVSQARELGEALLRIADAPHIPQPPTESRH